MINNETNHSLPHMIYCDSVLWGKRCEYDSLENSKKFRLESQYMTDKCVYLQFNWILPILFSFYKYKNHIITKILMKSVIALEWNKVLLVQQLEIVKIIHNSNTTNIIIQKYY